MIRCQCVYYLFTTASTSVLLCGFSIVKTFSQNLVNRLFGNFYDFWNRANNQTTVIFGTKQRFYGYFCSSVTWKVSWTWIICSVFLSLFKPFKRESLIKNFNASNIFLEVYLFILKNEIWLRNFRIYEVFSTLLIFSP